MNIESVNVSICLFSLCVSIRSVAPNSKECWWYLPLQNCHVGKKHLISSYPPYSTIFHHNIYPWHICLKQCHHTLGDSSCWFTTTRIGEMASAGSRGRALGVFTYRKMWKTPCGPPRKIVYKWLIFHIYVGLPYRVTPKLNCEYSRKLNVMFVFFPEGPTQSLVLWHSTDLNQLRWLSGWVATLILSTMLLSFFSHLLKSPQKRWSISLHPTWRVALVPLQAFLGLCCREEHQSTPIVKALETSNVSTDYWYC